MYQNLLITSENGVQTITINRPAQLNALNKETISELSMAFKLANDDKAIGVILLTGQGEKSFVAGADIKEFVSFSIAQGGELAYSGQESLFNLIENLSKPVIAVINGYALGGGLELAMACHLRVAATSALFGLPEVSLGLIPGYGGTQRLAQLVGKGRANELIFTAGMISAEEAWRIGLVNHIVAPEDLLNKSLDLAKKIMKNSGSAIASAITAINAGFTTGVNGYEIEIEAFGKCFGTQDFKIGTSAFIAKEKPGFRK
jgi:enoyl-CoA hydratase